MKKRFVLLVTLLVFGISLGVYGQEKTLTIDECVQIALEQNPDIVRQEFTYRIAGKDVIIAFAAFLPEVSANMGYYHSVVGPSSMMRIDPGTGIPVPLQPSEIKSWGSYAGFSVYQPIIDGGYSISNFAQSLALKKSAKYTFEDMKQNTIYIVKERYYNLLAAEKLLQVAEETVGQSEESYKRAQVLFEVGKAPKSDVLQAKVQQETDRLSLIQAQNNLTIARASLNQVLGMDVDKEIKVVDDLEVPEIEVGYEDARANAFAYHPTLLSRTHDVKASKAGIGLAISQYLPNIGAYYSYDWSHKKFDQIENMFDTDYRWSAGVYLQIPIFQGFSRIANLSRAQIDYKSSKEALAQAKRDIALETKQAYFEVQQSKKSIAVAQNAIEAAEEGLRLNREKYNLGAGTMLDLIVAQVSYTSAQSDHISALYGYKRAIARLQRAMGKLEK